jgi:hypothetical protein
VSLLSLEDENRSNFQTVVFSSFLEYETMDRVQKSGKSERKLITSISA